MPFENWLSIFIYSKRTSSWATSICYNHHYPFPPFSLSLSLSLSLSFSVYTRPEYGRTERWDAGKEPRVIAPVNCCALSHLFQLRLRDAACASPWATSTVFAYYPTVPLFLDFDFFSRFHYTFILSHTFCRSSPSSSSLSSNPVPNSSWTSRLSTPNSNIHALSPRLHGILRMHNLTCFEQITKFSHADE